MTGLAIRARFDPDVIQEAIILVQQYMKRNTALLMAGASSLRMREAGSVNPETVDGEDEECYIYHGSCLGILRSFPYCYGVTRQEMISV